MSAPVQICTTCFEPSVNTGTTVHVSCQVTVHCDPLILKLKIHFHTKDQSLLIETRECYIFRSHPIGRKTKSTDQEHNIQEDSKHHIGFKLRILRDYKESNRKKNTNTGTVHYYQEPFLTKTQQDGK